MALVNFASLWACLAVLSVSKKVWFQSALFRHQNSIFSIGNFTRDANCQLAVDSFVFFSTEGPVDCTFNCIGEPQCLSFNIAAHPDPDGLYRCDLLTTDKYRAKEKDFQASDVFHYYSPWVNIQICLFTFQKKKKGLVLEDFGGNHLKVPVHFEFPVCLKP